MKNKILSVGLPVLMVIAAASCEKHSNIDNRKETIQAATQTPPVLLTAKYFKPEDMEVNDATRGQIGRGVDYIPISDPQNHLTLTLRDSMPARRRAAWYVVEQMLQPKTLKIDGNPVDVPTWHTWYEATFSITRNDEVFKKIKAYSSYLFECARDPKFAEECTADEGAISKDRVIQAVMLASGKKDLAVALTPENLSQKLRQTELMHESNIPDDLGIGNTTFSPSFVEHLLRSSDGIEKCANNIPSESAPPSETQFSDCIEEFPRSAVMIKSSWVNITNDQLVPYHDTDSSQIARVLNYPNGGTWDQRKRAKANPNQIYTVETKDNERFALNAIHFSTKDVREWLWVTLWWHPQPDLDFGEDRPDSINQYNNGVWANYKMCVASAFEEGDDRPWEKYLTTSPSLASVLKSSYMAIETQKVLSENHQNVTSWCSNPILEGHTNNARTNCVGCHQFSNAEFDFRAALAGVDHNRFPQFSRSRKRENFPADFAWSIQHEFKPQIKCIKDQTC